MKRKLVGLLFLVALATSVRGEFSFYLIDNFENGRADKWYRFGEAKMTVEKNPSLEAGAKDPIAESCGEYSLMLKSRAVNWFAGGIGTDLNVDASGFNRLQLDIYGSDRRGKIKIEVFDDDNNNLALEQDAARDWLATKDDKWIADHGEGLYPDINSLLGFQAGKSRLGRRHLEPGPKERLRRAVKSPVDPADG
jgi:hypothetical protein